VRVICGNYFMWQIPVATSCRLFCRINAAHCTGRPHALRGNGTKVTNDSCRIKYGFCISLKTETFKEVAWMDVD